MCVYLLLYQSLYDLPNPTVCNLKSVLVLTNALGHNLISVLDLTNSLGRNLISVLDLTNSLGRNLISVLDLTNPLGRRPISALVLRSHLKCQAILLILLCLAAPFFKSPGLFLFSICYTESYAYFTDAKNKLRKRKVYH